MAKPYETGTKVVVTEAPEDYLEWGGRVCKLLRFDRSDTELPYRVEYRGQDVWVHDVESLEEHEAKKAVAVALTNQVSQTGEKEMTTQQTKITAIVSRAKEATYTAATLQAGKALNIAVIKAAKSKAPMMVRGYLDHPAAPALMALALVSASEFLPEGPTKVKIVKAADLMLVSSMVDGADKFLNLESLMDQVFNGLPPEVKTALEG